MSLFALEYDTRSTYKYVRAVPGNGVIESGAGQSRSNPVPISSKSSTTPGIIDVYAGFDWTTSSHNQQVDTLKTPFASVEEYRILNNSIFSSILYYTEAAVEAGDRTLNGSGITTKFTNIIDSVKDKFIGTLNNLASLQQPQSNSPWLAPYDHMYSYEPTNFRYFFPYFTDEAFNEVFASSSWSNINLPIVSAIQQTAKSVAEVSRIITPGTYVERPKMFDMSQAGNPTVSIRFPLLNTQTYESAIRNYQLLWLLVFQNTAFRATKSVIEMPKIYRVRVPGVKHLHLAYISQLSINFIGNRRGVDMQMPSNSIGLNSQSHVIMPDAYAVEIKFTSLFSNASNMMLENWKQSTRGHV